ncbi:MAG: N-acetylmuramoyl-L-alanine amidase, partial [Candidatus Berkiella sp.]
KGDLLASVLLDLSQTASESASHDLANHLISNLGKVTDLHHKTLQRAGFMVLKSTDITSVLVELGFISNLHGEKKLQSEAHQKALATALLTGVQAYVAKRPKPLKHADDMTVAKK